MSILRIQDEKVKQVLRDAAKKEKERQKAEEEFWYVDSSRNCSVVFGSDDLSADINVNAKGAKG